MARIDRFREQQPIRMLETMSTTKRTLRVWFVICSFLWQATLARRLPFLGKSITTTLPIRGGETSLSSSNNRPAWLDMDRETLQSYLQIAKKCHAEAIRNAEQNYWSGGGSSGSESSSSTSTTSTTPTQLPNMDTYGIVPPSTWKLPDFSTELDTSRMIFVTHGHDPTTTTSKETPLFPRTECQQVIRDAEAYFLQHHAGKWTTLPSGQYDVAGFWIKQIPAVHKWFNEQLRTRLFPLVQQQFPEFVNNIDDLVVDNAYVFKYTPETGRRTGVHTDSGCLSFTIALNDPLEYTGGGTWFQGLVGGEDDASTNNSTILMKQGHVTVRPGGVRHSGHAVTSGTRYIIGGFCMHKHKVEHARMLINLGADRVKSGDLKGAAEAFEAAICINPQFDGSYSQLANVYEGLGELTKAQQALEHCLHHVNPYCAEVAYSLGVMYLDQKEVEKAKRCAETCLELDDCDTDAMNIMMQAASLEGDKQSEEAWCIRLVQTPGVPDKAAASAFSNLGVLKEGQEDEIVFYQKALQLNPKNFAARYSLACAFAQRSDWSQAAESFRVAVEVAREADRPELNDSLKLLYRSATYQVQEEAQRGEVTSQEAMLERIQTLMGRENYAQLAASRGK